MSEHCRQILRHVEALAAREYWSQLEQSPEFVVLFLPLESLLSSALRFRHELLEESISRGVMLVTPVTLIALLRAVEYGWKQETLQRNVEQVCEVARDLHSQVAQLAQHLAEVGRHLDQAVASHNRTVAAVEQRILLPVRQLSDLGVPTSDTISRPDPVTRRSRPI
jgi:DNA recombination protein RmuC